MTCSELDENAPFVSGTDPTAGSTLRPSHHACDLAGTRLAAEHRERAHRMAISRVRRWSAPIGDEEVRSIADLALCEAASRFNPSMEVAFETYLFYFIRGALCRAIETGVSVSRHEVSVGDDEGESTVRSQGIADELSSPERRYFLKELGGQWRRALRVLSPLERDVVVRVIIEGAQVTSVARELGYSRGHLSEVKRNATVKLRKQVSLTLAAA